MLLRQQHSKFVERREGHVATAKGISFLVGSNDMSASEKIIVPGAQKWIGQLGSGFHPNLQHNGGRGENQVGLIYDRDGYTFFAVTGRKADDLRSGIRVTTHRKRRIVRERRSFLVRAQRRRRLWSSEAGRRKGGYTPAFHRGPRGLMQWWFKGANGARRCLLPNASWTWCMGLSSRT